MDGCKLRMRRNSKKLYFSGYPSIQIPLLFSFCVTVVLTSSGIGSLLRRCMTVAVTRYDYNFCHKKIAHDVPLPAFPLQLHFPYVELTPPLLQQRN